eukprot:EG_transcript_25563
MILTKFSIHQANFQITHPFGSGLWWGGVVWPERTHTQSSGNLRYGLTSSFVRFIPQAPLFACIQNGQQQPELKSKCQGPKVLLTHHIQSFIHSLIHIQSFIFGHCFTASAVLAAFDNGKMKTPKPRFWRSGWMGDGVKRPKAFPTPLPPGWGWGVSLSTTALCLCWCGGGLP